MTGNVDAAPGEPDAAPAFVPDFESDEGGEVRFEYIVRTDTDPDTAGAQPSPAQARAVAFFMSDQDPQAFPLPGIEACTNLVDDEMWPMTQGADRQYIDVGDVIISGGDEPLVVPIVEDTVATKDPFLRTHDHWYYRPSGLGGGDIYSLPNRSYDVFLTGSDDWPAQAYDDALWMPQAFNATSQLEANFGLEEDTPLTVTWDPQTTDKPAGFEEAVLIAFTNGTVGPKYVCLANNDGEFEVPANIVNQVRADFPEGGTFARQVLTHGLRELTNGDDVGERRIDFIAVWCYVTAFTVP